LPMEELKALAALHEPDERQRFFVVREADSHDFRPIQAADIHALAEQAALHAGVPEVIRSHFSMAQNLLAYSWFFYPFNVAAELHAYVSVEFALKTRFPNDSTRSFGKLLEKAVTEGLLRSEGFTYGRNPDRQPYPPETTLRAELAEVSDYAAEIAKAMRLLRNSLAHGASTLHMKGGTVLLVCSEVINQLFPLPGDA
jgi:hypothetical protein